MPCAGSLLSQVVCKRCECRALGTLATKVALLTLLRPVLCCRAVGEAVWSPRWYDYSMSVAPAGREGVWTAFASAPLFAAKLPTGMISGWLLEKYCPANGSCTDHTKYETLNFVGSVHATCACCRLCLT